MFANPPKKIKIKMEMEPRGLSPQPQRHYLCHLRLHEKHLNWPAPKATPDELKLYLYYRISETLNLRVSDLPPFMGGVRFNRRHIRRGNRRPLFKPFDHIFSKPARVFTAFFLHRQIKSGQFDEGFQQFLECISDSLAASGASFFILCGKPFPARQINYSIQALNFWVLFIISERRFDNANK